MDIAQIESRIIELIDSYIDNKINEAFKKLNLTLDSSLHDIKRRYKILVKKYHPDANKSNVKSNNKLIEINEAYKIIIDNY